MSKLNYKLKFPEGNYDVMIDPEIGTMELREIGIASWLEFNAKEHFAYDQNFTRESLIQLILDIAENLNIDGDETEVEDRMTNKITRKDIDFEVGEDGVFWITLFYDSGIGNIHRQGKMEMMVLPHLSTLLNRFDYYEIRKKIWITKIATDCRKDFEDGMEMDDFNRYVKKKNLLWLLEDIVGLGYDVWDFVEDINRKITYS